MRLPIFNLLNRFFLPFLILYYSTCIFSVAGDQLETTSPSRSQIKTDSKNPAVSGSFSKHSTRPQVRTSDIPGDVPSTAESLRRGDDIWTRMILPDRGSRHRQPGSRIQRQLSDPGSQIFKYLNRPSSSAAGSPTKLNGGGLANGQLSASSSVGQRPVNGHSAEVKGREDKSRPVLKRSRSIGVPEDALNLEDRVHRYPVV